MASKVTSNYFIGNVPIYAGSLSGAHTQNGCIFNLNIRVKPEVNTIGFTIIKTHDPLIHSLDNTTSILGFELDLSNLCKFITLLKIRNKENNHLNPTKQPSQFLKLGVTSQVKYADKVKIAWLKIIDDSTTIILENNGIQEQFVIEGYYQNEYLLESLIAAKDLFIIAKGAEESKIVTNQVPQYNTQQYIQPQSYVGNPASFIPPSMPVVNQLTNLPIPPQLPNQQ